MSLNHADLETLCLQYALDVPQQRRMNTRCESYVYIRPACNGRCTGRKEPAGEYYCSTKLRMFPQNSAAHRRSKCNIFSSPTQRIARTQNNFAPSVSTVVLSNKELFAPLCLKSNWRYCEWPNNAHVLRNSTYEQNLFVSSNGCE